MNRPSVFRVVPVVVGLFLAGTSPGRGVDLDWQIRILDSEGDVGSCVDLQSDDTGDLHVVYWRSDDGTLKTMSRSDGVWGAPVVVDSSGSVDGHCALVPIATGQLPVSYHRSDVGALWYAGPEIPALWTTEPITSEPDDVGHSLRVTRGPAGEVALAFRNQTQSSLLHVRRTSGGGWSPISTVDAGPGRGAHCDLTYRDGVGYAFSYYMEDGGRLALADPVLTEPVWVVRATGYQGDIGRQMSMIRGPGNRFDYICSGYDSSNLGQVYAGAIAPDSMRILDVVEDSVATSTSAHIYPDLFHTPDHDWYVSFRNATNGNLYMATIHDWQLLLQDVAQDPTGDAGHPEPRLPHLLSRLPNPTLGRARIEYFAPAEARVQMRTIDAAGRVVLTRDAASRAGVNAIDLCGNGGPGSGLPAGVYFVQLRVAEVVLGPQRIVIVR